ncbi:hypothetical protein, partial [Hylemonella gracilis]|uniref:hypothetical protein n=1 Tax=Hylemonella gracilis TaxID=80880 RepID=UPI001ED93191
NPRTCHDIQKHGLAVGVHVLVPLGLPPWVGRFVTKIRPVSGRPETRLNPAMRQAGLLFHLLFYTHRTQMIMNN